MKKHKKKSDSKLSLNATTLQRMDMAQASGGMMSGPHGPRPITTVVCTLTCGCATDYTAAQACCFTC